MQNIALWREYKSDVLNWAESQNFGVWIVLLFQYVRKDSVVVMDEI